MDDKLITTQDIAGYVSNGGTISQRLHESALLRLTGFSSKAHRAKITAQIPDANWSVVLQWFSGIPSSTATVFLGNPCRETPTGAGSIPRYNHYSLAANRLFKQSSQSIAQTLTADGLDVVFVNTDSFCIDQSAGMIYLDSIHPNNYGHQVLSTIFLNAIRSHSRR